MKKDHVSHRLTEIIIIDTYQFFTGFLVLFVKTRRLEVGGIGLRSWVVSLWPSGLSQCRIDRKGSCCILKKRRTKRKKKKKKKKIFFFSVDRAQGDSSVRLPFWMDIFLAGRAAFVHSLLPEALYP